jgi:hypothetical protein
VAQQLRRFPMDFGALATRAEFEATLGEPAEFTATLETLLRRLAAGGDRTLPWDLRVSLAGTLARGKRLDLATVQMRRIMADLDEKRVRALNPSGVYHLLLLSRACGVEFPSAALRDVAREMLPPELRTRV